jgi:hypothetical protein
MSKKWTLRDDQFLVQFYPVLGDYVGTHDLGRPAGAADARVKKLQETGAWAFIERMMSNEYVYLRLYYEVMGNSEDLEMLDNLHPGSELAKSQGFETSKSVSRKAPKLSVVRAHP